MKGKSLIIGGIIIAVIAYLAYSKYLRTREQELFNRNIEMQTALIGAQTAQSESCSNNWMCATTNILSGLGNLTSGISIL